MDNYVIFSDTTCDMTKEYFDKKQVKWFDLAYAIGDIEHSQFGENQISLKEFYDQMREGKPTRTSQVSPTAAEETLESYAKEGIPVLAIIFSSAISGTFNSVNLAVRTLKEKYPEWQAYVVDSLCASMGHGLFLDRIIENKEKGMSIEENLKWAEENKLRVCHLFTVEDLTYLHRGGRVSKLQAIVGTLLKIKPCLHVSNEGKLISIDKVRGRMKSIEWLAKKMFDIVGEKYDDKFFISHADSLDDATTLKKMVQEKYSVPEQNIVVNNIGPVIGSHSGPGTVALFFFADRRKWFKTRNLALTCKVF